MPIRYNTEAPVTFHSPNTSEAILKAMQYQVLLGLSATDMELGKGEVGLDEWESGKKPDLAFGVIDPGGAQRRIGIRKKISGKPSSKWEPLRPSLASLRKEKIKL